MKQGNLSGKAKIAGVIGWPVAHSLSPRLHNYWLAHHMIDGAYIPMPVKPEDLESAVRSLPKMGFRGANVTIPHKERVMAYLDHIDDDARHAGAVNTIIVDTEGKLRGTNTDIFGFAKNIRPHLPAKLRKAVVLGTGGAAKAVCYALMQDKCEKIVVAGRNRDKAEALAAQCKPVKEITVEHWEKRSMLLHDADLLVNATSLGMTGQPDLEIDLYQLPKSAVVTDVVYAPVVTSLLKAAKKQGNLVVDGLGMLIHQAVPGFKAWFGANPDVTRELKDYLAREKIDLALPSESQDGLTGELGGLIGGG